MCRNHGAEKSQGHSKGQGQAKGQGYSLACHKNESQRKYQSLVS